MTIYSQHASRGKTQILATFQGPNGNTSATVTSLADPALAEPIVDALNRISALATIPVSIYDTRGPRLKHYPTGHLAALTKVEAREDLLHGDHSLWYQSSNLLLHQALLDLDEAVAAAPEPVRIAIKAELETEARNLIAQVPEYYGEKLEDADAASESDTEPERLWERDSPFVLFTGWEDLLGERRREQFDRREEGTTPEQRESAVADLRILRAVVDLCPEAHLDLTENIWEIFYEPDDSNRHFLNVLAPDPGEQDWVIELSVWEPDDPSDDDEYGSATGRNLLTCTYPERPAAADIADLLNRFEQQQHQAAQWAMTPIGTALGGSVFIVTEHAEG